MWTAKRKDLFTVAAGEAAVGVYAAVGAGHVLQHGRWDAAREGAGPRGVYYGGHGACAVGRDDVVDAGEGAAGVDLGECGTALGDCGCEHGEGVFAASFGSAEAVGGELGAVEDGCVGVCCFVVAGAWDDAALDSECCAVAAGVALDYGDFAMGGNEGWCYRKNEESREAHVERCD
ncbi:hypothetical protein OPT61_g10659 [Boeremia exigua]|uniref:Uncharacterized protein n=1 Tax=Boeremia exigua TaxID=749465 RepID=A0ACC2HNT9_9PLEO|nr:hypothetical protein OPT61_g10659 [Boeremia exigua]